MPLSLDSRASMDFELLGPYRIEGVLGRGGMGTVYRAVHSKSGDVVAIKVIAGAIADQQRFRRRFHAEIDTLKRLNHPNVVQLIGYGEEHGHLFYSMQFVDGQSLHERLKKKGRLTWQETVQAGIEVAAALKQAHDMGIIHRDLKPANLMIDKSGSFKLTDFGIAKLFGAADMTAVGAVVGTADYMPPEQAEGKVVTTRGDLYSLGSVLFGMLTGKPPFGGRSVPETLYAVRYTQPPALEPLAPDAPKELIELIYQLLEKDPAKRPPTALVVGNRLKAMQQGLKKKEHERSTKENPPAPEVHTSLDLSELPPDLATPAPHYGSTHDRPTLDAAAMNSQVDEDQTFISPNAAHGGVHAPSNQHTARSGLDSSENTTSDRVGAGKTRFTEVNDDDRMQSVVIDAPVATASRDWGHIASIAMLVALLFGCVVTAWYWMQPRSADAIFEDIRSLAESGDQEDLNASSELLDEFLARFPADPRSDEVEALKDDVELDRVSKLLLRKSRRVGGSSQLSPLEYGLLRAIETREKDPSQALVLFQSLTYIFKGREDLSRNEQRLLDLAVVAIRQLENDAKEKTNPAVQQLEEQLVWIESSIQDKLEREKALRGMILIYGDEPWAKPIVEKCERLIEQ